MPAEVRLTVVAKEARLTLKRDDAVVEDEIWRLDRRLTQKEMDELCRIVFDDAYDALNFAAHGD